MSSRGANEELIRATIVESPLGALLGIGIETIEADRVRLRLPFRGAVTTVGDVIHGGAISALIDSAATAAAWTGADLSTNPRGTTIALTVNFVAAARGQTIVANARVTQRGKTITFCEVEARDTAGKLVATALVTYKLG